jgi:hypothetical protein
MLCQIPALRAICCGEVFALILGTEGAEEVVLLKHRILPDLLLPLCWLCCMTLWWMLWWDILRLI